MSKFNIGDPVTIMKGGLSTICKVTKIFDMPDGVDEVYQQYEVANIENGYRDVRSEYQLKPLSIEDIPKQHSEEYNLFKATLDAANADMTNDESFFEMAGRLPRDKSGRCKLAIAVGGNERNIAHFHVFRSEEDLKAWRNGACLYFKENKYYDHANNTETLTRDELKDLIRILKSRLPDLNITNWTYLVSLWNYNNDRYPIDPNLKMPDYDYKTITRYKEKDNDG